jgi:hypothetical protein
MRTYTLPFLLDRFNYVLKQTLATLTTTEQFTDSEAPAYVRTRFAGVK